MASAKPVAIIDIGSNSVRLVVYAGPKRIPAPIFNEKVLAGLGAGLDRDGLLDPAAKAKAFAELKRFRLLLDYMKIRDAEVIATAAIRDAVDGPQFVRDIRRIGLDCKVVSAVEEARLAGAGVLSGMIDAEGIAGDLGGGSLELVDIAGRETKDGISLPLGVLRIEPGAEGERKARKLLRSALADSPLREAGKGRDFYMIGGSWRALARIDMAASDYPLPITHQYRMAPERAQALRELLAGEPAPLTKSATQARFATSPAAAMLLALLVEELEPSALVASAFGVREGLLYSRLGPIQRRADPLIEAARDIGAGSRRFAGHGDLLDRWIHPLFDDPPPLRRLRHTACLLADAAWQANAAFRADRAIEMALHGNWVGIDAPGRVIVAQALSASFGRNRLLSGQYDRLCSEGAMKRARRWGHAMRLGQRLSGGLGAVLERTALSLSPDSVRLTVPGGEEALAGEAVERRLERLAAALNRRGEVVA